jgi:hypothetical protein
MPTFPTLDHLRQLLLRQEMSITGLSQTDQGLLLIAAATTIPAGTSFSEKQITQRLQQWLSTVGSNIRDDAVELRRHLIDCRLLTRDPAGRAYSRTVGWPDKWQEIADELDSIDIKAFAEQVRTEEIERRAARKKAAMEKKGGASS